jgi:hypothetical protein
MKDSLSKRAEYCVYIKGNKVFICPQNGRAKIISKRKDTSDVNSLYNSNFSNSTNPYAKKFSEKYSLDDHFRDL